MTLPELAAAAGDMRPQYLLEIEEGQAPKVHIRTLQKLADALGVTLGMITGEELPPPPGLTVFDEVAPEYQFVVKVVVRLVVVLGSLLLLCGLTAVGGSLLFQILRFCDA